MAGGQALVGARTPAFRMSPWDMKIPGLDKVGKSTGPVELVKAHDGRLDFEKVGSWKPGFVESIVDDGVWQTVIVWKDGDGTPWVVDGVQRVLGARAAAKIREKQGDDRPMLVPTLSPAGKLDDVQRFALSLKMNHLRHDDPPLVEAAKIGELFKLAVGGFVNGRQRTETEALKLVADAVGKTAAVIRDLVRLDSAPTSIKSQVQAGTLTQTSAAVLQSVPVDQQAPLLEEIRKTGPATTERVREGVRTHKATKKGKKPDDMAVRPSVSTMRKVLANSDGLDPEAKAMLRWVLGEVGPRAVAGLSAALK